MGPTDPGRAAPGVGCPSGQPPHLPQPGSSHPTVRCSSAGIRVYERLRRAATPPPQQLQSAQVSGGGTLRRPGSRLRPLVAVHAAAHGQWCSSGGGQYVLGAALPGPARGRRRHCHWSWRGTGVVGVGDVLCIGRVHCYSAQCQHRSGLTDSSCAFWLRCIVYNY